MKKSIIYLMSAAMTAGLALAGCSAEDVAGVSQKGLPQASDIDATITVDQSTNEVTFKLNNHGCVPIWTIYTGKTPKVSTNSEYHDIVTIAGTYQVDVQMYNHNGVCDGVKTYEFTIDNTIVDFGKYMTPLTGGASKEWRIDADTKGHLGCGPSGTEGLEWWCANPGDKESVGVYDNRMTFTSTGAASQGEYTFDPGASGTIYVNTGISGTPYDQYNPNDGNDFCAPAQAMTTTFDFKVEGPDLFLVFPQGTLMGYLPNAEAYNEPKFKVYSISNSKVELSIDNGGIAWHYILGLPGEPPFRGFKYDSEYNLWKQAEDNGTAASNVAWYYAPGWSQLPNPELTVENGTYSFTLPAATTDQWQGQMLMNDTGVATDSNHNYDFSCIITCSKDHPGVTIKLTNATDDVFYFDGRHSIKAGEDFVYYVSDMPGLDIDNIKMVFDFGGNAEDTEVTISNIVIKDHANDDGTVLPVIPDVPETPVSWVDYASGDNLWYGASMEYTFWWADNGWSQISDPDFDASEGVYTILVTQAPGGNQWQAQTAFLTDISTSADQNYDFKIKIESSADIPGVTVKLTKTDDDNLFYTADRHDVKAYEENVFTFVNMAGLDIDRVKLVLDFAGAPQDCEIKISDIILQTHRE